MSKVVSEFTAEEIRQVYEELPEIRELRDETTQRQVAEVWARFLRESSYARIADAPAFPGMPGFDLARHTRHVVRNSIYLGDTLTEFWGIEYDREDLIAAALTHDASKLVEMEGPDGKKSAIGETFVHAQLAGVRCLEAGLSHKVANLVTMHPFTPPHVHVTPRSMEMIILTWADLGAVDPIFFLKGFPTHLEFKKRFFQLD